MVRLFFTPLWVPGGTRTWAGSLPRKRDARLRVRNPPAGLQRVTLLRPAGDPEGSGKRRNRHPTLRTQMAMEIEASRVGRKSTRALTLPHPWGNFRYGTCVRSRTL